MSAVSRDTLITIYGVLAVTFMMTMYALERRHPAFILAFAAGCLASAAYGFLSGAWPFGVVEAIWSVIAVRRYLAGRPAALTRSRGARERLTDPGAGRPAGAWRVSRGPCCEGAATDRCLGLCRPTTRSGRACGP